MAQSRPTCRWGRITERRTSADRLMSQVVGGSSCARGTTTRTPKCSTSIRLRPQAPSTLRSMAACGALPTRPPIFCAGSIAFKLLSRTTRRTAPIASAPRCCRTSQVRARFMNSAGNNMNSDRELGLDRSITRRDFLNGVSLSIVGAVLAPELVRAAAQEYAPERAPDYYPPARVGMRGDHPGSFEVAHALRDRRQADLTGAVDTGERYDLVIVGGGLSGLSAADYCIRVVGSNA